MTGEIQKSTANHFDKLVGTYRATSDANNRMAWAAENAHLISPATSVGHLPEGVGLALTVVTIDVKTDTYSTEGGKLALTKSTLQKIAHAVGLSWDPERSGRLDDCKDAHYVRWQAVGTYRAFDGQKQTLCATKELDLRDGSEGAESGGRQLRQQRLHIQSHAETKAQLRAIRSLGIKSAYTPQELQKPFVAARVMFTGETDDPELKRIFANRTADAFLDASTTLYGGATAPAQRIAPVTVQELPENIELPENTGQPADDPVFRIPGGPAKGVSIHDADDLDLQYWIRASEDEDLVNAMTSELERRR